MTSSWWCSSRATSRLCPPPSPRSSLVCNFDTKYFLFPKTIHPTKDKTAIHLGSDVLFIVLYFVSLMKFNCIYSFIRCRDLRYRSPRRQHRRDQVPLGCCHSRRRACVWPGASLACVVLRRRALQGVHSHEAYAFSFALFLRYCSYYLYVIIFES